MRKIFWMLICCVSAIVACTEGSLDGGDDSVNDGSASGVGQESVHGPITLQLNSVTATTAVFTGSIDMTTAMLYTELGIIYSTEPSLSQNNGTKIRITSLINNRHFTENVSGLPHSSKIYYAPYYCTAAGLFVVGDVKSFETIVPKVEISVDEASITRTTAKVIGTVSGVLPVDEDKLSFGFAWSDATGAVCNGEGYHVSFNVVGEGSDDILLYDLNDNTAYYYCYYIEQGKIRLYGPEMTFTTAVDPYKTAEQYLDVIAAVDLSSSGTANSYIVSEAGLYKFKTVKGNSNVSVGDVASCSILWESFGTLDAPERCELINSVYYNDGYIAFNTNFEFKEGNALLAAKDSEDNILWSWHIWMTDKPSEQVYYNNAGTMMDRNLGATSSIPSDGELTYGLLYQWGRKDPFMGAGVLGVNGHALSTIDRSVFTFYGIDKVEESIKNPTTLFTETKYSGGDWASGDTRWTTSDKLKSIYDPCPAGWRVPDGGRSGIWAKACNVISSSYDDYYEVDYYCDVQSVSDEAYQGMNLSGKFGNDNVIWYPNAGYDESGDGIGGYSLRLTGCGLIGQYWSATYTNSIVSFTLQTSRYDSFRPLYGGLRANALYVRCQKE